MEQYKHDFIEFALSRNVLKFGKFILKSGRISPYFFNAGLFNNYLDNYRSAKCFNIFIRSNCWDF